MSMISYIIQMKPRIKTLVKVFEKAQLALAYSQQGEHQKCLNVLLELKEKRWINFELFYKIAEQYVKLGKLTQANDILNYTRPQSEEDKKQFFQLKQQVQSLINEQISENQYLFVETTQLQNIQKEIKQYDSRYRNLNTRDKLNDLLQFFKQIGKVQVVKLNDAFYEFGYFQNSYKLIEFMLKYEFETFSQYDQQQLEAFGRMLSIHTYELVLDLLSMRQDDYKKYYFQGFCYQQMKQYKLALSCYTKSYQFRQSAYIYLQIFNLTYQMGLPYQKFSLIDITTFELCLYVAFYKMGKTIFEEIKPALMEFKCILKQEITAHHSVPMFLYHELFQIEYDYDKQHQVLQQICNHLIKYAPRYAAGYSNQFLLFIDQNRLEEAYQLAHPLMDCEDSTLKFITLGKIYLAQQQYTYAHTVLEQAKELNKYEEEIYLLYRDVYQSEKNYQKVREIEKFIVQLEKENYIFICKMIAPMMNKFEYYRAAQLLEYCDQENVKLKELKLLMKIISQPADFYEESIIDSLDKVESSNKYPYYGHYWLSQGNLDQAIEYYQLSIDLNPYNLIETIPLFQKAIIFITDNKEKLNFYKINNIIWQISLYDFEPIEQENYFYKRFVDTLGFVLVSFIFPEKSDQICQFINSKYDVEVPHINGLDEALLQIVEAIYRLDHISIEKYYSYVHKGISQLKKLFISQENNLELSIELFYEFCSVQKNEVVELMNFQNNQPKKVSSILKTLYEIPFFYDPVARIALLTVIKMVGYFVDNELVNNYQSMDQWLRVYMLKQNVEAYYRTIIKQKKLD